MFSIYLTSRSDRDGELVLILDASHELPAYPKDRSWTLFGTFSEDVGDVLVGNRLLRAVAKFGFVVTARPLHDVIRRRSTSLSVIPTSGELK